MVKQKNGVLICTLFLFLFLYGVLVSSPAQAGVQLKGWKDINPMTTPDGTDANKGAYQYVLFGKYSNTPIVWRILSADQSGTERKGYLFSDKALGGDRQFHNFLANNYGTSDIRTFLVSDGVGQFYVSDNFTDKEKNAVVVQSFTTTDGMGNGTTTTNNAMFLPSYDDLTETKYGFSSTYTDMDVNRKAFNTSGNPVLYWSRSPVAGFTTFAWSVLGDGDLYIVSVYNPGVAARPACFLNLESLIFKSASNDFDLSTPSSGEAGSISNPYVLVLPGSPITSASGWTTQFISADKTPVSATVSGKTVTLEWNTAITQAVKNWPAATDFVLSTGQSPISVASAPNNNKALKLNFAADVALSGLKISYSLNTDAIVFAQNGTQASVVNSFANLTVTQESASTPNVIPTQARYDGSSPADLKELLGGAALTAAKAGKLSITDSTPDGTRIPLGSGDYSIESRNLTIFISFLSKLGDGTHTLYFYNGDVQVGKVTLIVTNSTGGDTKDSGSSGCNAGFGSAGLLAMGMVLLGLNKTGARKKK